MQLIGGFFYARVQRFESNSINKKPMAANIHHPNPDEQMLRDANQITCLTLIYHVAHSVVLQANACEFIDRDLGESFSPQQQISTLTHLHNEVFYCRAVVKNLSYGAANQSQITDLLGELADIQNLLGQTAHDLTEFQKTSITLLGDQLTEMRAAIGEKIRLAVRNLENVFTQADLQKRNLLALVMRQ